MFLHRQCGGLTLEMGSRCAYSHKIPQRETERERERDYQDTPNSYFQVEKTVLYIYN